MGDLFYGKCEIGPFTRSGISIEADYFSGDTRGMLSLGFRSNPTKRPDIPVSLYNFPIRKLTNPTNKVLAIFRKKYNEIAYKECTFLSKGQSLGKLHIPDDIQNLISMKSTVKSLMR